MVAWKQYQDLAPTLAEVEGWWTLWPEANVALPMGHGLFALDIDGDEGWAGLEAAGIELDRGGVEFPYVATSKGAHFYFRGDVPDRIGVLPKVDVRSAGGYVVAPPSIHPSGRRYEWSLGVMPAAFPDAPAPLLALLARPTTPTPDRTQAESWVSSALSGVGEGSRNVTCARLAGYFLGKGVEQDVVEEILRGWAARCQPPYDGDRGNTVEEIVARIAAREGAPSEPPCGIAEALDIVMAEITAPPEQRRAAAPTQLGGLDALLSGGLYPGDYVIVGARPSVGKTALALQIARKRGHAGDGVLLVSREMTRSALLRRLLSQETQVRAEALKTGNLIDLEKQMLEAGAKRLRPLPLWITNSVFTPEQLAAVLAGFAPGVLKLVICDYLQLFDTQDRLRDQRQRVEQVSKGFRRVTIEQELALIALSSLSRPPRDRPNWRPSLADLRESGELEHDADGVWLMHRELDKPLCELQVAKNRDGQTGQVNLNFNGSILTFEEAK